MDRLDQMSSPLEVGAGIFQGNPRALAPPGPGSIQEELVQEARILTETLSALSEGQLELFREALQQQLHPRQLYCDAPRRLLAAAGPGQAALLLLEALGPRCLAAAGGVLAHIGRGDLGRRLVRPGPRRLPDETPLIRKVAEVAAFKHLLLASLDRLDEGELKRLKWELQFSFFQTGLPQACWGRLVLAGRPEVAQQLLGAFGRRCLEVAAGLFRDLGQPHLLPAPESSKSPQKGRDDVWPALTQKVGEMAASANRLLGALRFLSGRHLKDFKRHVLVQIGRRQRSPSFHHRLVALTDLEDAVLLMVAAHGQQAEQQAWEVLQQLGRRDVAGRLLGTGELPLGHWTSDLIHTMKKVATMAAVKQLLVDVCNRLSPEEPRLVHFLKLELSRRNLVQVTSKLRPGGGSAELLDVMLETIGRRSVEVVRQVLLDTGVDRADVLQNLPESSGGGEERHSVDDEEALSLEEKEKALESVGAVLSDLSVEELDRLRWLLRFACFSRRIPAVPRQQLELAEPVGGAARLLVDWLGRRAVEVLREVLPDMSRADLVRKLPAAAPPPTDKPPQFKPETSNVWRNLRDIFITLDRAELEKFKETLQKIVRSKGLRQIPRFRLEEADAHELAELMAEMYQEKSEELTMMTLEEMKLHDLVWLLHSSGSTFIYKPPQFKPGTSKVRKNLMAILITLDGAELKVFKEILQKIVRSKGLRQIPRFRLEEADAYELAYLMVEMYEEESEELTMMTLEQMNRPDLIQLVYGDLKLKEYSRAYKMYGNAEELTEMALVEPYEVKPLLSKSSSTVEGDIAADGNPDPPQPDSDGWTKLQPEVVHTEASRAPTYSLVSEPGHFECSISGLRWVCEQKSSFEYRFCSWDGHMERMESRQYSPAGPLMDITVTAGKLAEVQLPHWVCTEGVPDLLGNFAVLHMDGCGEVLEKVSGVTPTHVKLTEPSFTSLGSVIKSIFRVKINCSMLIYYQPETSYLKLRVYLIPQDPALQQNVHYEETASGYEAIKKPRPDRPLKINQGFTLTASTEAARIQPKKITLRYDSLDPNFYELFMENPSQTFNLELQQTKSRNEAAVWSCEIRKDDYPKSGDVEAGASGGATGDPTPADDEHFVDKHMAELVQRVTNTKPILDALLKKKVIQSEQYKAIRALPGSEDQVRELYCGPLRAARACKDIFCSLLRTNEPLLMAELSKRK